jgi:hypothetical protein
MVLIHDLAARVGTASDEHEYGDNKVVWLENGRKVLDYMEADERFSAASFKDSMEEQGIAVNRNDLITWGIGLLHRCLLTMIFHSLVSVSIGGAVTARY